MKSNEAVRAVMAADGITQMELANKLGYKTQSGVGNALSRENGMRVDVFVKMMNAMGYDVIVRRGKDEMTVTE
ncbi:helix-turn-helix domain-containing protein [Succinimonas sp.]|uniref:helix-turn-helix domain-containing protein n=1 Tax=Succinimonas sp. TaxID=1936151 RepID=UPI0038670A20